MKLNVAFRNSKDASKNVERSCLLKYFLYSKGKYYSLQTVTAHCNLHNCKLSSSADSRARAQCVVESESIKRDLSKFRLSRIIFIVDPQ